MRMRKKKNLGRRMEAVKALLTESPAEAQGRWRALYGGGALFVELGCGKGRFARQLASLRPDALVVGAEKVPDVLVMAMEEALREGLPNVRFVAMDACDLPEWFAPGEIDGLFINFCDPWPHWKQSARRLTSRGFLEKYRLLLADGGTLRFKTDDAPLFAFTQKELSAAGWTVLRLERNLPRGGGNIETEYERRFRALGTPILYLEAKGK